MLRRCEAAGMLGAVFLLFPLFLLLSLLPSLLFLIVSFLLLMFLFMCIGTTYVRRRSLLSTKHFSGLVLVFLMFIFMFSLRGLIYVPVLFWELQSYIMQFNFAHIYPLFTLKKKIYINNYRF